MQKSGSSGSALSPKIRKMQFEQIPLLLSSSISGGISFLLESGSDEPIPILTKQKNKVPFCEPERLIPFGKIRYNELIKQTHKCD